MKTVTPLHQGRHEVSDTFHSNSYHCAAGGEAVRPQTTPDNCRVMLTVALYEPTWTRT